MTVYLIITGEKIRGYATLRRLCKENGNLNLDYLKKNLPFKEGKLTIKEIKIDERL